MTLTELRYIVAVAQGRHFGRAARRCFVSQLTLSIAIKKLEEELSVSLFDRSSNDIITIETGECIVAQARCVLEEADLVKHLANEEQNEPEGAFKLGLIFTVAPYLLSKLVMALRESASKMPLMLEENYTYILTETLKRGDLDAIVVVESFQEPDIVTKSLYDEPFFVIVPKGHPFEELDAITPHLLLEEKILLLTEGNCMRDQMLASCSELAAKQRVQGSTNTLQGSSINTIRHMVVSGFAISIMPATTLAENDHMLFNTIPLETTAPKRRVVLTHRRNFVRPKVLTALRNAISHSHLNGVTFIKE